MNIQKGRLLRLACELACYLMLLLAGLGNQVAAGELAGHWDSGFRLPPGVNGTVNAMASLGNNLYVGGSFSRAGSVTANSIARWDGTNWFAVGGESGGISGIVSALAFVDSNLYVGGQFKTAGTNVVNNIAKWNGLSWESLGEGVKDGSWVPAIVLALYPMGKQLYVGGCFLKAGGMDAKNIARWDGNAWHTLGDGARISGYEDLGMVNAITGNGQKLYVGGIFTHAGDVAATNLAQWDGTRWDALGQITGGRHSYTYYAEKHQGIIYSLAMHQGSLFAGGDFRQVDQVSATNLAKWDGLSWSAVGNPDGEVYAMVSDGDQLAVAGDFEQVAGKSKPRLAFLEGGEWKSETAGFAFGEYPNAVTWVDQKFYIGGNINAVSGVNAKGIARKSGNIWSALGAGSGNTIADSGGWLAFDGTNIYAAGAFTVAGTNPVPGLAKWDGANWEVVGTPFNGRVKYVTPQGTNLFIGGDFVMPEIGATNLACWNGQAWCSIGGPFGGNYRIENILAASNRLYVSGWFWGAPSSIDVGPAYCMWDGARWQYISGGVASQASEGDKVYVVQENPMRVSLVNGTNLVSIGGSIPDAINDPIIAVSGTNIFLAGLRSVPYGSSLSNAVLLYTWSGLGWQLQEFSITSAGMIRAFAPVEDGFYFGGRFSEIGGISAHNIAKFAGGEWHNLGPGIEFAIDCSVLAMLALKRTLFVAGRFDTAGGHESPNFAIWHETPNIRLGPLTVDSNRACTFDISGLPGDEIEIQKSSPLGRWEFLNSITLTNLSSVYRDEGPAEAQRFYRAVLRE